MLIAKQKTVTIATYAKNFGIKILSSIDIWGVHMVVFVIRTLLIILAKKRRSWPTVKCVHLSANTYSADPSWIYFLCRVSETFLKHSFHQFQLRQVL